MDLKRLEDKQDKIFEEISEMKTVLAQQSVILDVHVKRTDLAEANLELLRQQIKPLEERYIMTNGALKLLGGISATIGFVYACIKLFESLLR